MIRDYHRDPPGHRRGAAAPRAGTAAMPRRRWRRWAARALAATALAGGLAWAGARAARAMPPWPYFRVAEVMVEGNLHLGREEVLAAIDLPPRANLLTLDLARLAARLGAHPWVREATVQRRLPDRLVVRLVERAPAAILQAGPAYLVGGDGVILSEVEEDEASSGLPILRAPGGRRYTVGERVAPQELNEALWAWRQVQLAPALGGRRPAEVALWPDGSYRVRMEPGALGVRLRAEGLEPQLRRLAAVLALRGGTLEGVEEVDLRFPEKVILRQRPAGPRTTAGRDGAPVAGHTDGGDHTGSADLRLDAGRPKAGEGR
ncbi:MAG TPA: FtsQ-type POTRA domain-containing protein [Candidatus Sulfotelmatobacter sp.]|nr:FtsQ-type POTRA domain-containing protein [Candidatus Sulfotelmatobacter sp.]